MNLKLWFSDDGPSNVVSEYKYYNWTVNDDTNVFAKALHARFENRWITIDETKKAKQL